jgi:hypothetical protein
MADAIWNWFTWLETTDFSTWVREGDFIWTGFSAFYVILGFHSIGMAIVVGVSFILSLRLFGYYRTLPIDGALKLIPLAWAGFTINLISGIVLFVGQSRRELLTMTFNIKILMILLAVLTLALLQRTLRHTDIVAYADGTAVEVVPEAARTMALLSNLFWIAAIISGRLIGYTQPPPP